MHSNRITFGIGPALLIAFAANALLLTFRPRPAPFWLAALAAACGALVLAYTAFVAVPLHGRLANGPDPRVIAALNATELIRALATFAQAAADVAMLAIVLRGAQMTVR